jgi:hypothetical protein
MSDQAVWNGITHGHILKSGDVVSLLNDEHIAPRLQDHGLTGKAQLVMREAQKREGVSADLHDQQIGEDIDHDFSSNLARIRSRAEEDRSTLRARKQTQLAKMARKTQVVARGQEPDPLHGEAASFPPFHFGEDLPVDLAGGKSGISADKPPDPAESMQGAVAKIPELEQQHPGLFAKLRQKVHETYTKLERRYGRTAALAILGSGHALSWATPVTTTAAFGVPVMFPGQSIVSMAPGIALAEAWLRIKKALGNKKQYAAEPQLQPEHIQALANRVHQDLVNHVGQLTGQSQTTDPMNREGDNPAKRGQAVENAYAFFNPNTEDNLSYEQAYQRFRSGNQKAAHQVARNVADTIGLGDYDSYDAIGDWVDPQTGPGSENSVAMVFKNGASPEAIDYAAAWLGLLHNQKAVLTFHSQHGGPDSAYQIPTQETDARRLQHQLNGLGIQNRALIPTPKGHLVVIVDPERQLRDAVGQFGVLNNATIRESAGKANWSLGGKSRTEARQRYWNAIRTFEHRTPVSQHYRPEGQPNPPGQSAKLARSRPPKSPAKGSVIRGLYYPGGKFLPKEGRALENPVGYDPRDRYAADHEPEEKTPRTKPINHPTKFAANRFPLGHLEITQDGTTTRHPVQPDFSVAWSGGRDPDLINHLAQRVEGGYLSGGGPDLGYAWKFYPTSPVYEDRSQRVQPDQPRSFPPSTQRSRIPPVMLD